MISGRILDDNTSQNESFYYSYPHSNALLQFRLELERCKLQKASHHPKKCDVINDLKQFQTYVYRSIYWQKIFNVANSLEPDKARHFVRPDLAPNCLQRLSADDKSHHW